MEFFEPLPPESEFEPSPRRAREPWEQPDFVLPGTVAQHILLLRTDTAAVSLGSIRAYPTGFEFTVHARRRPSAAPTHGRDRLAWSRGLEGGRGGLRLGLLFADGRRATNDGFPHAGWGEVGDSVHFIGQGGGASENSWDGGFWVHPLPPEGPLAFFATWPDQGVDEVSAVIDAAAVRLAAADAVELWPEDEEWTDEGRSTYRTVSVSVPDPGPDEDPDRAPGGEN
ncbi:hypothetical protein ACEZDB_17060 [Streptacidiphilus sp. N1-3]|uniref:Uncharacterized protein n=1 Tax=Streptacidiphilus alkalitolerans TaxID=3342712 RepID=A0ABV6X242_9ACTN